MKQMLLTCTVNITGSGWQGRWKFILVLQVSLNRSRIIKAEGPQMQIHTKNKFRM